MDSITIEKRTRWLKNTKTRILFYRMVSILNVIRHLPTLREAKIIWCHAPHYFWWLVILAKLGLLPTSGKQIYGTFYKHGSFRAKLNLFRNTPTAFKPIFCLPEQVSLLEAEGAPKNRLSVIPCRIDTQWFQPVANPKRDYILCAGNIHREEKLVKSLVGRTPLKIIRVGQLSMLYEVYAEFINRPDVFEMRFNLSYDTYLQLLQNAALVILPISPCDEPAGLTASLEAFATGVPLLTNDSLGIATLLREAYGKTPVPTLETDDWLAAIEEALQASSYPPDLLQKARTYICTNFAINPDDLEWQRFVVNH